MEKKLRPKGIKKMLGDTRYRKLVRCEKREQKAKRLVRELWNIYKLVE